MELFVGVCTKAERYLASPKYQYTWWASKGKNVGDSRGMRGQFICNRRSNDLIEVSNYRRSYRQRQRTTITLWLVSVGITWKFSLSTIRCCPLQYFLVLQGPRQSTKKKVWRRSGLSDILGNKPRLIISLSFVDNMVHCTVSLRSSFSTSGQICNIGRGKCWTTLLRNPQMGGASWVRPMARWSHSDLFRV